MNYYLVKYSGPFGFIKPWTAVRDGGRPGEIHTFSQQFLTPSITEGIEKKLFPELLQKQGLEGYITGHRINYTGVSRQQEQTWSKAWVEKQGVPSIQQKQVMKKGKAEIKEIKIPTITRKPAISILTRGILIEPNLYLAFSNEKLAQRAAQQHICLCRNEDVLLPESEIEATDEETWFSDAYPGFELLFNTETTTPFKVGYNRFNNALPMYGQLKSFGDPIRKRTDYI